MTKEYIEKILNEKIANPISLSGKIETESGKIYFLKTGSNSNAFRCEANGLKEIAHTNIILTPEVISTGNDYILTEYIENSSPSDSFFETFGKQLADLHRIHSVSFGFYENNYIGNNEQINTAIEDEKNNWPAFYFNKRLLYQYRLAEKNEYITAKTAHNFSILESTIENILEGSTEPPTLLHGDLWGENYLCDKWGNAVLIDPAVYYGHREADLAMTRLFGGFAPAFYQSYMQEYPLAEGWQYRENIYKLYHILNHLNLFGRSYLSEAEYIIESYM